MPPVSLSTTPALRASIFSRLTLAPATSMPCSWASWVIISNFSLESSMALLGMQPTFRQVPPSEALPPRSKASTQAVLRPSCAARMAAT